ncbi:adenylosuccinate synthase [Symbiobacterium thermophilum]|uniref:Adenylosuccinate synthetase n=1 Tax=Symbiobacterium thermophilum (strain DSM 24528 / JCM 14929 / IAM 14863 / T) TaxID=292459 RepID=PURA_SYMTH|nr:adenylosuccinate synthase [Symbiobacterium thermophilum]Q67J55.1 RecName: Full=Adenylosuccinate synthetase; Short=AMPSase; Short=AdSS; AltName: Full=IMP--aspartate ligase [Symbiobacterium thermophilum IAM 14863]BAD42295.1 adenylosuccinate synthetase [Symbiobacterium thermophilum IAM 14863]
MPVVVVMGAQWGDEGKGKFVDLLAERAQVVVRSTGGSNAGHTVWAGGRQYKLHQVPSGILYPGTLCVIGHGVVLDPPKLLEEMDRLASQGVDLSSLRISGGAHIVFPFHIRLDEAEEDRKGDRKIGTTRRGIGPAYMDKFARVGIRLVDMLDRDEFLPKLTALVEEKNRILEKVYGLPGFTVEEIAEPYLEYAERLRPYVANTVELVNDAIDAGKNVLFEGAQGHLLDIDFGTYPYVTASHPIAAGAIIGAGVGPTKVSRVVGVVKAYTSRVGEGPFPTELHGEEAHRIREEGHEYGTTTGRPRRIGWLDLVMVRYACRVSGITDLAVPHLDTLAKTGLPTLKVCVGYRMPDGTVTREFPVGLKALSQVEPVYEELPNWEWSAEMSTARQYDELPEGARRYVRLIEDVTGVRVSILGVGSERTQAIYRSAIF